MLRSSACLNAGFVRMWAPHSGFLALLCLQRSEDGRLTRHGVFLDRSDTAQNAVRHSRIIRTVEREEGARFGLTDTNIPVYLATLTSSKTAANMQFLSDCKSVVYPASKSARPRGALIRQEEMIFNSLEVTGTRPILVRQHSIKPDTRLLCEIATASR